VRQLSCHGASEIFSTFKLSLNPDLPKTTPDFSFNNLELGVIRSDDRPRPMPGFFSQLTTAAGSPELARMPDALDGRQFEDWLDSAQPLQ